MMREFSQIYDVDYEDTFVSTMKYDTFQVFMTLIALENLKCHQVDVNNVFMKSFLREIIYITSFFRVKITQKQVLCIMHSLYDLKQVTRD